MLLFNTSQLAVRFTRISSMSLFFHPIVFLLSVYEKKLSCQFSTATIFTLGKFYYWTEGD